MRFEISWMLLRLSDDKDEFLWTKLDKCLFRLSSSSFILKTSIFFTLSLGKTFASYEVSWHIPEYFLFRLLTNQFHFIIHTFFPSLPSPAPTLLPLHISIGRHSIIYTLHSRSPNHLNLPCYTTSLTFWITKRLYKSPLRFSSINNPQIHLTITYLLQTMQIFSPIYQHTLDTSSVYIYQKVSWDRVNMTLLILFSKAG